MIKQYGFTIPSPTSANNHIGGWRQLGASVVGGSDGCQQLMAAVGGSGGKQEEKT